MRTRGQSTLLLGRNRELGTAAYRSLSVEPPIQLGKPPWRRLQLALYDQRWQRMGWTEQTLAAQVAPARARATADVDDLFDVRGLQLPTRRGHP
jgi:hypothetical protein